ncbi:MAG: DUF5667 domain-containing protein [Parcubacteria group bacterium]
MKDFIEKLKKVKKERISSDSWSNEFEKKLALHIEKNPIGEGVTLPEEIRPKVRIKQDGSEVLGHTVPSMFGGFRPAFSAMRLLYAIIILGVGSMGLSAAAQESLPGDTLYGWKLHVNENVVSAVTFGEENQARYEVKLADNRLNDLVEVMADEEKSENNEEQNKVRERLQVQIQEAERKIEQLEEQNRVRVALMLNMQLQNSLQARGETLSQVREMEQNQNREEIGDAIGELEKAGEEARVRTRRLEGASVQNGEDKGKD